MSRQLAKRWISADEYERMGEAGIFHPDDRLELIEGEIYEMSPIGSPHAACVSFLTDVLSAFAAGKFMVRVQNPIRLNDFSEPQPDLALVRRREDYYRGGHPTPADVLLVVEVADSTVETDRKVKVPLYAQAGVAEAWVVNIPEGQLEIYAEPAGGAYQFKQVYKRGEEARSHTLPQLKLGVAELLG